MRERQGKGREGRQRGNEYVESGAYHPQLLLHTHVSISVNRLFIQHNLFPVLSVMMAQEHRGKHCIMKQEWNTTSLCCGVVTQTQCQKHIPDNIGAVQLDANHSLTGTPAFHPLWGRTRVGVSDSSPAITLEMFPFQFFSFPMPNPELENKPIQHLHCKYYSTCSYWRDL